MPRIANDPSISDQQGPESIRETTNLIHLLGAGGLGGMSATEKWRTCEGVNDHMQHREQNSRWAADAEREGDQAHVFDGGVGEEAP